GILGGIGIAVSGADSNRVYAIIEARDGGLFRSDDAGQHWTRVNDDGRFRQRAWYFSKVYADPKSADTVYLLNTGLFKSVDGGKTFTLLPARHGDHHGLWIDPTNPNRIANVSDGGASISTVGGNNLTTQHHRPRDFITWQWTTPSLTRVTVRNSTIRMSALRTARTQE